MPDPQAGKRMGNQTEPIFFEIAPTYGIAVTQLYEIDGAVVFVTPFPFLRTLVMTVDLEERTRTQQGIHGVILAPDVAVRAALVRQVLKHRQGKLPPFGDLPITQIGIGISTTRPSDAIVIESAELTGMDTFEEVVNVEDIARLGDPLKERLLEIARQHTPELV